MSHSFFTLVTLSSLHHFVSFPHDMALAVLRRCFQMNRNIRFAPNIWSIFRQCLHFMCSDPKILQQSANCPIRYSRLVVLCINHWCAHVVCSCCNTASQVQLVGLVGEMFHCVYYYSCAPCLHISVLIWCVTVGGTYILYYMCVCVCVCVCCLCIFHIFG